MYRLFTAAIALATALPVPALAQTEPAIPGTGTAAGETVPGQSCNATFAISDSDNDGTITRAEFDTWNDTGFARLDANGDGELSSDEFRDCMRIDAGEDPADGNPTAEDMASADTDASGSLSAEEYMRAANRAHRRAFAGEGDGVVLMRRLILVPSGTTDEDVAGMSPSEAGASAAGKFRTLDLNRDGEISKEELEKGGWDDMDAWLNLDFDEMDRSGDGTVSRDEYDQYSDRRWQDAVTPNTQVSGTSDDTSTGEAEEDRAPQIYYLYFPTPSPQQ